MSARTKRIYGAIRYDDERREMAEIIRATYIPELAHRSRAISS